MIKKDQLEKLYQMFQYVDEHFDRMTDELCRVASMPSVEGNSEGLENTRTFIVQKMKQLGLDVAVHEVEQGNSLITGADIRGRKNTVLFYNHYDVVPAGDLS